MNNSNQNTTFTYSPCNGDGHYVVYTGELPNGTPCACGRTRIFKVKCKTCKIERTEFRPIRKRGK